MIGTPGSDFEILSQFFEEEGNAEVVNFSQWIREDENVSKYKDLIDHGLMIPESYISEILEHNLSKLKNMTKNTVLLNFPRSIHQCYLLNKNHIYPHKVIVFNNSKDRSITALRKKYFSDIEDLEESEKKAEAIINQYEE